ncbi:zinc finger protein 2-like [Cylas formicarius]|uniref:zinc finger protein 2-like n=1 Tax=Cylas formicarius TaxID=197179 RepID=UPI0029589334|nr:zinc finger protein 2-like [Cylas formicarius]
MEAVSGYRYICNKCGKAYKAKRSLSRHLKYECSKVPSFQCPVCFTKSYQKCHIKMHMYIKHPDQCNMDIIDLQHYLDGYRCLVCSRIYRQSCSLSRHVKYECQKERSFRCPFCPYASHQKAPLIKHQQKKHAQLSS